MTHYYFIQSVSAREYEAGVVMYKYLLDKSLSNVDINPVEKVKTFDELQNYIKHISEIIEDKDNLVFYIDLHSDGVTFTFKDILSQNKADYTDYHPWEHLTPTLDSLYGKYGRNVVMIFVSCFSSAFFTSLKSPHVYVIAAEGKVYPMRARQMLSAFYDDFCINENLEQAYNVMVKEYPIEDEIKNADKYKVVLKLFK